MSCGLRFVGMFELVGRFQQYKRATESFLSWLAGFAPPRARRAREILLAAQRAAASDAGVPTSAIDDLQRAISLRKQVYLMYGDKDARHAFFIELLEDVKNILLANSAAGSEGEPGAMEVDVEAVANRFERLVIEGADCTGSFPHVMNSTHSSSSGSSGPVPCRIRIMEPTSTRSLSLVLIAGESGGLAGCLP